MIIGHGKTMEILKREHPTPSDLYHQGKLDEEAASSFDIHDELAWDEAFRQVASMRKPVEIIMNEYVPFFNRIKDVPKICVYGVARRDGSRHRRNLRQSNGSPDTPRRNGVYPQAPFQNNRQFRR